jgi:hypothetical protein
VALNDAVVNHPETQVALFSQGLAFAGSVAGAGKVVFGFTLGTLLSMLPVVVTP